ncbi:MAG: rhamnulokinase [Bacteroidaceae bacterium]|nr:rhamnulokinase [Bacteroidaceae bacterium]MBQ8273746.1 rhamnulokinase [Bacteroidaceae bacterium]
MSKVYLAADFGGGSGRVIAGWLEDGKLTMEEIHRFGNRQVRLGDHVYWDFPALFEDMKAGLKKAASKGYEVESIGVDTWGVDFGLIDRDGQLLGNPVCYRDARTAGMTEKLFETLNPTEHYATTGIQVMEINTLAQLLSIKGTAQLEAAEHLLFMPDLFSYFLTGKATNEYCIASTSELLDAKRREWSWETIEALGLPKRIFGDIVMPGTVRGELRKDIAEETGLKDVKVIAVGSHDTASAVAAVPAIEGDGPVAFLSSGTWSLLGIELPEPILTEEARQAEFTNEGGVGGRIRFLQNITGLWILQRLMAEWKERGEEQTFGELLPAAAQASISSIIPVADAAFTNPPSMEKAISDYCRQSNQPVPQTKGEFVRCLFQSLAKKYKDAIEGVNGLLPESLKRLHIIGGGSQNGLLNQFTADALGIPVWAGPVEATAMGNILVQAMAAGEVADLAELREVVRRSVTPKVFEPNNI